MNKGGIVNVGEPHLIGEEGSHCFFPICNEVYTECVVTTEEVRKAIIEAINRELKLHTLHNS